VALLSSHRSNGALPRRPTEGAVRVLSDTGKNVQVWYVEGFTEENSPVRRIPLHPLPFRIGRKSGLPLSMNLSNVSRVHAELFFENGQLLVRDLDSRNGTFVNRSRIHGISPLRHGDIVHFGHAEFRVGCEELAEPSEFGETCEFHGTLPAQFVTGTHEFLEMMRTENVLPVYQALVRLEDRHPLFGYELLGRGYLAGTLASPYDLFKIAAGIGFEDQLSRLLRSKGLQGASKFQGRPNLFLNIHPVEMRSPKSLVSSLAEFRRRYPNTPMTAEISETLVTSPASMREFSTELKNLQIELAYDDFGAGQGRLAELAEAPPNYLKFDRGLIASIDSAPPSKVQLVRTLLQYAQDLGVMTLAEGVETEGEARVCADLGFKLGQGYYYARPAAIESLIPAKS
jgi:EAL domain-containing protein (putative c-di-GMP-specific phosphodiesterase class I)